jgi:RimJ/RimL family protein N-acetyltransferase
MSPSRLKLVDGTLALLSAALEGRNALEGLLGVSVAEGWEGFPDALPILRASYEEKPEGHMWGSLFFIELEGPTLVGFGGFKGSPSPGGVVEIGYAIAPAFRGKGLATEAVAQMVHRAFADVAVRAVDAHTLGQGNPSTRVLQKTGFRKIAEIEDPEDGPIWQWRLERPAR